MKIKSTINKLFARDKKPPKFTVNEGPRAFRRKETRRLEAEAKKTGRAGGTSATQQKTQHRAMIEGDRNQALTPLKRNQAREREQLRIASEAFANFDKEAQREKHRTALAVEKEKEKIRLETQKEAAEIHYHKTDLTDQESDNALRIYEDENGTVSDKFGWLQRYPHIFSVLGGGIDLCFNYPAFIEWNFMPLLAMSGAVGLAALQITSGHSMGRALSKGHYKTAIGWGIAGLVAVGAVAVMRFASGHFLITLLLLLAFLAAGAMGAYYHSKNKKGFALKKAKIRAEEELKAASLHLSEIEKNLESLDTVYENRARKLADDDHDLLATITGTLPESIEERKEQITGINNAFDAELEEGQAIIEAAFQEGQARDHFRNRRKGNRWGRAAAAILCFTLFLLPACKSPISFPPAETYQIDIHLDKSSSMSEEHHQDAEAAYRYILEITGLNDTGYAQAAILVNVYFLGDQSVPRRFSEALTGGDAYAIADVPARRKVVAEFKTRLKAMIDQAFEAKADQSVSQIHRGTAHGFEQLSAGGAQHRYMIVVSDFIEQGALLIYKYSPEELRKQQDTIIKKLLEDTPLPNLSGIQVLMLTQSQPGTGDDLTYRCAQLFKTMWEQQGQGAKVKIQHSF